MAGRRLHPQSTHLLAFLRIASVAITITQMMKAPVCTLGHAIIALSIAADTSPIFRDVPILPKGMLWSDGPENFYTSVRAIIRGHT